MEQKAEQPRPQKQKSDHFPTVVAVLIAIVSIVSAAVVWRAAMAEGSAAAADRQGIITTIKYEAAYAENVRMLYQEAQYAAQHLKYQVRATTLRASDDTGARGEAQWVEQIVVGLSGFTPLTTDSAYHNADGSLDLESRLADLRAADADLRDLDAQQDFDQADRCYAESQLLVAAVSIFAASLFFLTLAEITRRRIRILLAIAGAGFVGLGLLAVAGIEAYFLVFRLMMGG
ncbi:MAG: hypothetical protein JW900_04155 [Anaerolineae bacterium]|nr:hypothetical protein [Anaerolineae bacterium]